MGDVFTLQDNWSSPSEPTEAMTFSSFGLSGYDVQYWNGSSWVNVTGGSITGNNKVWRKLTFSAITTTKIRVLTNASPDGYSRLTEFLGVGQAYYVPSWFNVLAGVTVYPDGSMDAKGDKLKYHPNEKKIDKLTRKVENA